MSKIKMRTIGVDGDMPVQRSGAALLFINRETFVIRSTGHVICSGCWNKTLFTSQCAVQIVVGDDDRQQTPVATVLYILPSTLIHTTLLHQILKISYCKQRNGTTYHAKEVKTKENTF